MAETKLILRVDAQGVSTIHEVTTAMGRMRGTLAGVADGLFTIRNYLGFITLRSTVNGLKELTSSMIQTADTFQKMQLRLQSLGVKNPQGSIDWVMNFARKNPIFELKTYMDMFVKFRAMGIDPMTGSMQSLVDATAAFGGDSQKLERAMMAITQISGKGVLNMEELRQQLAEHIPTATAILARELGITMEELYKKIEKGQISSTMALNALFKGFSKDYAGSAERMKDTWSGIVQEMKLTWQELQLKIMDKEMYEQFKNMAKEISQVIKDNAEEIKIVLSGILSLIKGIIVEAVKLPGIFRQMSQTLSGLWKGGIFGPVTPNRPPVTREEKDAINAADPFWNKQVDTLPETVVTAIPPTNWDRFWMGFHSGLAEMKRKFFETFKDIEAVGAKSAEIMAKAMSGAFDDFFVDVIEGRMKQFKDYLLSFFKDIGRAISQILSQYLAMQAIGAIMPSFGAAKGAAPATGAAAGAAAGMKGKAMGTQIQIINNTGTPVSGSAAYSQNDAGEMVMSIVLDHISRNKGNSRDFLRGALAT